jgi:acetolactate synthase-1/2/3 large subunit
MQELPAALQHQAPVTWIVMNNSALGWIKWYEAQFFDGRYISVDYDVSWRYDKVAEAAGCFGIHVDQPENLKKAIAAALAANNDGLPAVVDVATPVMAQAPYFAANHGVHD